MHVSVENRQPSYVSVNNEGPLVQLFPVKRVIQSPIAGESAVLKKIYSTSFAVGVRRFRKGYEKLAKLFWRCDMTPHIRSIGCMLTSSGFAGSSCTVL